MAATSTRNSTLPHTIAEELRRRIRDGELGPGDRLPGHRDLAAHFEVSLSSVREGISMLISEGLIETRPARGTYVAETWIERQPRGREIRELLNARELVESQIAAMAAMRAGPEEIARLRRCVERMYEVAGDHRAFSDADLEFHVALGEAAGNRFLLTWLQDVRALLRRDMELSAEAAIRRFGDLGFSIEAHELLVDAVESGAAAEAQRIALTFMRTTHEFVLALHALGQPRVDVSPLD
jgi:GntR family transcriptional repressor for pyruvate dehydrogenase complex